MDAAEVKDVFYTNLTKLVETMKTRCGTYFVVAGDLNAVIGEVRTEDKARVGPRNKDFKLPRYNNGTRLLELCKIQGMGPMNTWFKSSITGGTHHHPGQKGNYLKTFDFILAPMPQKKHVRSCRTVDHMDYNGSLLSDHRMVELR